MYRPARIRWRRRKQDLHLPTENVVQCGAVAAVRHVDEVDAAIILNSSPLMRPMLPLPAAGWQSRMVQTLASFGDGKGISRRPDLMLDASLGQRR